MTKRVDTSRGLTGCGPGIFIIACLIAAVVMFVVALRGGAR